MNFLIYTQKNLSIETMPTVYNYDYTVSPLTHVAHVVGGWFRIPLGTRCGPVLGHRGWGGCGLPTV